MRTPAVSVILTTFNRRPVLPRAIASVLAQDADFELIVVDDASTDDTQTYLAGVSDPRIHAIRAATNLGPGGARNLGIETARADVVAFLDSDDAYLPSRLSAPLKALESALDIACVLSSARRQDDRGFRDALIPDVMLAPAAFEWALICDLIPVEASSITVRRATALTAGQFCPTLRLIEDRDFLIRVARHGGGRMLGDVLWVKHRSPDGLSDDWGKAASGLASYVTQRAEYRTRFPAVGSYLATKLLVSLAREGQFGALVPAYRQLRAAGLLEGGAVRALANHRAVSRYRRTMASRAALAVLTGAPETWR